MSTATRDLPRAPRRAALEFLRNPYVFMREAQARYGDMFILDLGLTRVAIVNKPSYIAHVLRDDGTTYPKEGSMWDGLRSLLGNGLGTMPTDPVWRQRRRMMQPHFHMQSLAAITDTMAATIEEIAESLKGRTNEPIDMSTVCPSMTMRVIVHAIFGTQIAESDVQTMSLEMKYALEFLLRGMLLQALPGWLPIPGRQRYADSLRRIDDIVYKTIEQRRRGDKGTDLLRMLLDLHDEETGAGLSDQELHDEVVTLFLGGYETTAVATGWALYLIAQRPDIAQKILDEVSAVTGGARPTFEQVARLKYTRMVFKESLRYYPIAWQIMRTAGKADEIDGIRIPAGTQMMLSFCGSHRHPDYWPDPDRFDPERFSPDKEKARPREAWMPFGGGPRICIGLELAQLEGCLILTELLKRYSIAPAYEMPPRPKVSLTLHSANGVWLKLTPRA